MKHGISIALLLTFLLPSIIKVWILIDFKINQDYIAEVLCINKDEPKTGCGGKCYLSSQLKKQEEKEHEQVPLNSSDKIEILFVKEFMPEMNIQINVEDQKKRTHYLNKYTFQYLDQIFHPPQFS